MKFCPECGAKLPEGAKFCTECGAKLSASAAVPVSATSAEPVYQPPVQPETEPMPAEVPMPEPEPVYVPAPDPKPEQVYAPVSKPEPVKPQPAQDGTGPRYQIAPEKTGEKKPINRKIFIFGGIGLLAVIGIILAAIFLSGGENQGTKEDWTVYVANSCTVDGQRLSVEDEWIELKSKGKAELHIMGETYHATWILNGSHFVLEQQGDKYRGTLKDGVLNLSLGKAEYVFAAEGANAASAAPMTYKASRLEADGEVMDAELLEMLGGCYIVFNGDGTGMFYLFDDVVPISYDATTITIDTDVSTYTISDGKMECKMFDGSIMNLEPTDEIPAVDTEIEPTANVLHCDDLMTMLDWLGKTSAELGLDNETVSTGIPVETVFNDLPVDGTVWFEDGVLERFNLYLDGVGYEDLCAVMREYCGEATDEGEEPYAESNGGVVSYSWFDHSAGTIRVASASEYEFVEMMGKII